MTTRQEPKGVVKQAGDVPGQDVAAGTETWFQVLLGPDDGVPNFALRRFAMGEGGGMPLHTNTVEHEQFVLCGRAEVGIGRDVHQVEPGCVVYIPAGVPHYYRVLEAPFEFLCIVPNEPDQVEILD